jgi:hypothetical protein
MEREKWGRGAEQEREGADQPILPTKRQKAQHKGSAITLLLFGRYLFYISYSPFDFEVYFSMSFPTYLC